MTVYLSEGGAVTSWSRSAQAISHSEGRRTSGPRDHRLLTSTGNRYDVMQRQKKNRKQNWHGDCRHVAMNTSGRHFCACATMTSQHLLYHVTGSSMPRTVSGIYRRKHRTTTPIVGANDSHAKNPYVATATVSFHGLRRPHSTALQYCCCHEILPPSLAVCLSRRRQTLQRK